jgi:hypothetical protein
MVEVRDPKRPLVELLPDGLMECDCGVSAWGSDMAGHLVDRHGIDEPARAADQVELE